MRIIDKLKERWGIENSLQLFLILLVFACTGFTSLYARRFVFDLLGITDEHSFWFKTLVWLLTIFPIYNILLYFYGVIFGQREFFTKFLKKMLGRFVRKKDNASA